MSTLQDDESMGELIKFPNFAKAAAQPHQKSAQLGYFALVTHPSDADSDQAGVLDVDRYLELLVTQRPEFRRGVMTPAGIELLLSSSQSLKAKPPKSSAKASPKKAVRAQKALKREQRRRARLRRAHQAMWMCLVVLGILSGSLAVLALAQPGFWLPAEAAILLIGGCLVLALTLWALGRET